MQFQNYLVRQITQPSSGSDFEDELQEYFIEDNSRN